MGQAAALAIVGPALIVALVVAFLVSANMGLLLLFPFLACVLWLGGAAGLILYSVHALESAQSPFVKIFRDAVRVFRGDLRLLVVIVYLTAAVGGCALGVGWAGIRLARSAELLTAAGLGSFGSGLLLAFPAFAIVLASCLIVGPNAVLAEYFLSWISGAPELLLSAACRVARRFWRILGFTLLWSGLLAILFLVQVECHEWLRRRSRVVDMAVSFLFWAVEVGLVMAAYFMLVVMVRERVGPWKAFLVTLEITKEELGHELGELARIGVLDLGMSLGGIGIFLAGVGTASYWAGNLPLDTTISSGRILTVIIALPFTASVLYLATYYVLFQTLQLFLAAAVYEYLKVGKEAPGFEAADFDHVLGLRACGIATLASVRELLGLPLGGVPALTSGGGKS